MKRDMDLCRKILFKIEEEYVDQALISPTIDGYSVEEIAYHCNLLYDAGLLQNYNPMYAGDGLYFFSVGALTWEGHDFLDKIREDTVWNRTKDFIAKKGLPMGLEVVKQVAATIIEAMTTVALKEII